jgi:hypothetical protein
VNTTSPRDLKAELASIDEQIKSLEDRRAEIYRASVEAPDDQKVCEDFLAEMLGEAADRRRDIQYPIEVTGITYGDRPLLEKTRNTGRWVAIRPCDKQLGGKTFIGIMLGDVALSISVSVHRETHVAVVGLAHYNPAIWVPDLQRIVYGCESWWGVVKGPDDLRKITDQSINNLWYVKAAKEMGIEPVALDPPPVPDGPR